MKKPQFRLTPLGLAIGGLFGVAFPALPANTDIASEPLSQAASGVKPNVMFILDDSGSMDFDYSPDYVDDTQGSGTSPSTTSSCFDSGDTGTSTTIFDDAAGSISGRPDPCIPGDPPYMSSDFNKQYYNPAIRYAPGVDSTGTEMNEQNSANTSSWTSVPTDPYGKQRQNQLGQSATNVNLVSSYPDRVWCKTTGDDINDSTLCVTNSAYAYPDATYNKGLNNTTGYGTNYSGVKFKFGGPYYYKMQTAQWCTSAALSTCVSGNSVVPGTHTFIAPEFCTDTELTNCAAGTGVTAAHIYSGARFCSDQTTLLTCQRKKVGNFRWPKHLGVTKNTSVPIAATSATGTITVTSASSGQSITALTINGVSIISAGNITAGSSSTSTMATAIRDRINSHVSTPDYTASVSGSTVTITAATTGVAENGKSISVVATSTGTGSATATITVNNNGNNSDVFIEEVRVNHPSPSAWINIMATSCTGTYANGVITESGGLGRRIKADTGNNSSSERNSTANAIQACVDQKGALTGSYAGQVFDASWSGGNTVTITAPASLGSTINGRGVQVIESNGDISAGNFGGGVSATIATTNSGSLSGGADATTGTVAVRAGQGQFSRINIDPLTTSYTKSAARTDCGGTTCTYAEEMTNFANWYSYYRTRMQMMKSASGRAFVSIDNTFRVGFITINYSSSDEYLKIGDFDATQKSNWYSRFYDTVPNSGTPLRQALGRVGQMYAGKAYTGGIPAADDPVQYSCQPNFAILSTDGYWNGSQGKDIDNNDVVNQDNADSAPYSKRTDGVYDGAPSSPTVGLADVALYYYKTDLRPTGTKNYAGVDVSSDNVPTTSSDFASHQHMTTFTLGLGLDGELTYRSDYQTATTGDFYAIKQGTKNWPNPVADAPSALDDLWHAAVSGRGVFFSASNPQELANSLSDTLDALKKRVGAGAAAATSNLQPVAGDNFAFTAQYETQVWVGDLKARTIDLSSGAISTVELWSAQSKLNAMLHTERTLFTFDASDAYNSSSTGATGNQLKHFCHSSSVGAGSWCNDGAGLTATEETYFNPNKLSQYVSLDDTTQKPNATALNLINYLRGHQTYEDQGAVSPTDLFRDRAALLGDVINAQPSYVKSSPFNYNDTGYQDFKKCTQGTTTVTCPGAQFPSPSLPRRATVYIASNDGMLHAIETDVNNSPYYQTAGISTASTSDDAFSTGNNTGNGVERWAYIPGMVLPELYQLGNIPYHHSYLVDGSPTVGDICLSTPCASLNDWRTMLVAGLNSGGRGFYALDITNPLKPRAMWEFKVRNPVADATACAATTAAAVGATTDCDLGLSYGNPVITKLKSTGQWVVIVTSGLNNTGVEPGTTTRRGDGKGYLYVLNALNGQILHKIPTTIGDPGTAGALYADADPSGLARINNWVDNSLTDNTTLAVYGGDLKGNLWRFELDNTATAYLTAVKVAELKNPSSQAQPVTTKPELGLINNRRVIFLGTGKFLGTSDKSTSEVQSIYAIADDTAGNTTQIGRTNLQVQVISTASATTRTVASPNDVDWTSQRGWYIDLPDSGERVNVDPQLQLGTLVVASNVPSTDTCVAGGTAWINTLDFKTGSYVAGATGNAVSQRISGSVAVGINVIQLPGGKVVTIVTTADNQQLPVETPVAPTTFQGRRVGWRELSADQ